MLTVEQFFPVKWVLHGMSRKTLAKHTHWLWREHGIERAKKCISHAHWIGVYPVRWRDANGNWKEVQHGN